MEILTVIGIIIAAGAGFFLGKSMSSDESEKNRLEQELKDKTTELEAFHSKVNTHFEKTAELFNHVSDSYQSLYDHMANSSNQLCASQTFQVLSKPTEETTETQTNPVLEQNAKDGELFDANHLYNAHGYRNKDDQDEVDEVLKEDNKVVEIGSAKEETGARPLDYAVKAKGVINHNSLDMDGVKNS